MNNIEIYKALANETRLQILEWLKDPKKHFPASANVEIDGVCCGYIQKKSGLSQSTISHYLAILQRAGLITARRCGQWTYYKRNEKTFRQLSEEFKDELKVG